MDDDLSNESFVSSTQVFVLDKSTTRLADHISITVNYPHSDVALTPRNALLAKDLVYNKGSVLHLKIYFLVKFFVDCGKVGSILD